MSIDVSGYLADLKQNSAKLAVAAATGKTDSAEMRDRLDVYKHLTKDQQDVIKSYSKAMLQVEQDGVGEFRSLTRHAEKAAGITDEKTLEKMRYALLGPNGQSKEAIFGGKAIDYESIEHANKRAAAMAEDAQRKAALAESRGYIPGTANFKSRKGHRQTDAAGYIDEYGKWGVALAAATAGFMFGGPIGALIGLILGLALGAMIAPKLANFIDEKFAPEPPPPVIPIKITPPAIVQTPPLVLDGAPGAVLDLKEGTTAVPRMNPGDPLKVKGFTLAGSAMQGAIQYHVEDAGAGKGRMIVDAVILRDGSPAGRSVPGVSGIAMDIDAGGNVNLGAASTLLVPVVHTSEDVIKTNRETLNNDIKLGLTAPEQATTLSATPAVPQQVTFTYQHGEGSRVTKVVLTGVLEDDDTAPGSGLKKFTVSNSQNANPIVYDMSGKAVEPAASLVSTSNGRVVPLVITGLSAPAPSQTLPSYLDANQSQMKAVLDPQLASRTPPGNGPMVPSSTPTRAPGTGGVGAAP